MKKRREKKRKKARREKEKTKKRKDDGDKKIAEEWEIWNKEKEVAKSEEEAKKLVPQRF